MGREALFAVPLVSVVLTEGSALNGSQSIMYRRSFIVDPRLSRLYRKTFNITSICRHMRLCWRNQTRCCYIRVHRVQLMNAG